MTRYRAISNRPPLPAGLPWPLWVAARLPGRLDPQKEMEPRLTPGAGLSWRFKRLSKLSTLWLKPCGCLKSPHPFGCGENALAQSAFSKMCGGRVARTLAGAIFRRLLAHRGKEHPSRPRPRPPGLKNASIQYAENWLACFSPHAGVCFPRVSRGGGMVPLLECGAC